MSILQSFITAFRNLVSKEKPIELDKLSLNTAGLFLPINAEEGLLEDDNFYKKLEQLTKEIYLFSDNENTKTYFVSKRQKIYNWENSPDMLEYFWVEKENNLIAGFDIQGKKNFLSEFFKDHENNDKEVFDADAFSNADTNIEVFIINKLFSEIITRLCLIAIENRSFYSIDTTPHLLANMFDYKMGNHLEEPKYGYPISYRIGLGLPVYIAKHFIYQGTLWELIWSETNGGTEFKERYKAIFEKTKEKPYWR